MIFVIMFFRDVILKEFFVSLKITNFHFYNLLYDMKLCKFFELLSLICYLLHRFLFSRVFHVILIVK